MGAGAGHGEGNETPVISDFGSSLSAARQQAVKVEIQNKLLRDRLQMPHLGSLAITTHDRRLCDLELENANLRRDCIHVRSQINAINGQARRDQFPRSATISLPPSASALEHASLDNLRHLLATCQERRRKNEVTHGDRIRLLSAQLIQGRQQLAQQQDAVAECNRLAAEAQKVRMDLKDCKIAEDRWMKMLGDVVTRRDSLVELADNSEVIILRQQTKNNEDRIRGLTHQLSERESKAKDSERNQAWLVNEECQRLRDQVEEEEQALENQLEIAGHATKEDRRDRAEAINTLEAAQNGRKVAMITFEQFVQEVSSEDATMKFGDVNSLRHDVSKLAEDHRQSSQELAQLEAIDSERRRTIEELEAEMNEQEQQAKFALQQHQTGIAAPGRNVEDGSANEWQCQDLETEIERLEFLTKGRQRQADDVRQLIAESRCRLQALHDELAAAQAYPETRQENGFIAAAQRAPMMSGLPVAQLVPLAKAVPVARSEVQ